jgi:hypothetical protein
MLFFGEPMRNRVRYLFLLDRTGVWNLAAAEPKALGNFRDCFCEAHSRPAVFIAMSAPGFILRQRYARKGPVVTCHVFSAKSLRKQLETVVAVVVFNH